MIMGGLLALALPGQVLAQRIPAATLARELTVCIDRGYDGYVAGCTDRVVQRAQREVGRLLRVWPSRINVSSDAKRDDFRQGLPAAQAARERYAETDCNLIVGGGSASGMFLDECRARHWVARVKHIQSEHDMSVEGM